MRKHFIKSSILAGIASLLFSFSALKVGSLTDITKPYLGEYECKSATYGKKDLLEKISCVVIELREDNTFVLRYKDKKGKQKEETGEYTYDSENKTVRFKKHGICEIKRDLTLEKGNLYGTMKMGWNTVTIHFEQK